MQNGKGTYSKTFGFFADENEEEAEQRVIAEKGFDELLEIYMCQKSEFDQVKLELILVFCVCLSLVPDH